MKFKTTKKELMNRYWKVQSVGYCDLCWLLHFEEPAAYTCGVYGWNADAYNFGDIAIVTGYRPFGNEYLPKGIKTEYNEKAKQIINNVSDYKEQRRLVNELLNELVELIREAE